MTLPPFVSKITHFFTKKHTTEFHPDPYSDWSKLLIASFLISLVIIAVDGYLFYKIDKDELFSKIPPVTSHVPTFDRMLVQQENAAYDAKEQTFLQLKTGTSTVIDPSL